jgi:hypothetical protein
LGGNPRLSQANLEAVAKEVVSRAPLSKPRKKKYTGSPVDIKMQDALDKFGDIIAQKRKWVYLHPGGKGLVKGKKTRWSNHWASEERVSLDQARMVAVSLYDQMWQWVNENSAFSEELKERAQRYPKEGILILPGKIGFKIGFWDDQVNRYKAPAVSQILLADGKFYYLYADPRAEGLGVGEPIVETVEEARSHLRF